LKEIVCLNFLYDTFQVLKNDMSVYEIIKIISLLLFADVTFGQNKSLSGKVTTEAGEPIAFATVNFIGCGEYGTMTNKDGNYYTNIPLRADSVKCRHINFLNKTLKIEGNNIINFVLAKKPVYSNEVSIIGTHKYSQEEITKTQITEKYKKDNNIFTLIEIYSEFYGGSNALRKYLEKAIVYPDSANISDVKGIVKVGFTIGLDGYVKSVKIIKGVNKFADEAVLNAVKKMPKWLPALQNGSYIEQDREISVLFDIKGKIE
jgi:TonB family protein